MGMSQRQREGPAGGIEETGFYSESGRAIVGHQAGQWLDMARAF